MVYKCYGQNIFIDKFIYSNTYFYLKMKKRGLVILVLSILLLSSVFAQNPEDIFKDDKSAKNFQNWYNSNPEKATEWLNNNYNKELAQQYFSQDPPPTPTEDNKEIYIKFLKGDESGKDFFDDWSYREFKLSYF